MIEVKERPNIKDLVITEPIKPPVPRFDPQRDLTLTEGDKLDEFSRSTTVGIYINLAVWVKLLFPDTPSVADTEEYKMNAENYLQNINNAKRSSIQDTMTDHQLWTALGTAILYPDMFYKNRDIIQNRNELFETTRESFLSNMRRATLKTESSNYKEGLRDYLFSSLLFPDRLTEFISSSPQPLTINRIQAERYMQLAKRDNSWRDFTQILGLFRLIKPKDFSEINISDDAWKRMHKELEKERMNDDFFRYGDQAFWMNIIDANDVKLDSKGLHIIKRKPKKEIEKEGQIPTLRSF
jgi:hypothetical protein